MSEVKRQKNGELATSEIRKLIRAHNVLSAIKIPKGAKRQDIIELLKKKGYMIDHEKAEMRPLTKGKVQKMKVISQKKAKEVLPKPKTDAEKKEAKKKREKKKQEKETEAFKKREAQVKALGKVVARRKKEKSTKLSEVEKNRCVKAVNNARSVISLYEKQGGDIKKSDFSSKKDLMETIKDLKDMRPQLKLCPKSEQDIVDKALSLHSKGTTKNVEKKKEEPKEKKGKFDAFDKAVEEVKKEVPPIILKWLKLKKDPKLLSTLKDKDGKPIKKIKGGRKPLFVKEQEKYRDMVWNKVKEIYKKNNVTMPKKSHGAALFARSKGDWKTYGGVPKELEENEK
jgi:hypothetical protein